MKFWKHSAVWLAYIVLMEHVQSPDFIIDVIDKRITSETILLP